jgi:hypothetical protein
VQPRCECILCREATYSFRRPIPAELRAEFGGAKQIMFSLTMKELPEAKRLKHVHRLATDRPFADPVIGSREIAPPAKHGDQACHHPKASNSYANKRANARNACDIFIFLAAERSAARQPLSWLWSSG